MCIHIRVGRAKFNALKEPLVVKLSMDNHTPAHRHTYI